MEGGLTKTKLFYFTMITTQVKPHVQIILIEIDVCVHVVFVWPQWGKIRVLKGNPPV